MTRWPSNTKRRIFLELSTKQIENESAQFEIDGAFQEDTTPNNNLKNKSFQRLIYFFTNKL